MTFHKRREALRAILKGSVCTRAGSVYDPISARIAEDLGFELGMFGGSVASLAILGDPDVTLITLTELAEQMRRMSRAPGSKRLNVAARSSPRPSRPSPAPLMSRRR